MDEQVTLSRDVDVITIPFGAKTNLKKGQNGHITQALGGSYTVMIGGNLFRIDGKDADAIGKEKSEEIQKLNNIHSAEISEKAVWDVMKTCYDPEIPVNIVDLGLIYSCKFKTKNSILKEKLTENINKILLELQDSDSSLPRFFESLQNNLEKHHLLISNFSKVLKDKVTNSSIFEKKFRLQNFE